MVSVRQALVRRLGSTGWLIFENHVANFQVAGSASNWPDGAGERGRHFHHALSVSTSSRF